MGQSLPTGAKQGQSEQNGAKWSQTGSNRANQGHQGKMWPKHVKWDQIEPKSAKQD